MAFALALLCVCIAPMRAANIEPQVQSEGATVASRPDGGAPGAETGWTHLGRTPWRTPWAQQPDTGPPNLGSTAWTADKDDEARALSFLGGVGVVVHAGRVMTTGFADGQPAALAFDADTGVCAWSTPIPPPVFSSWSTPAIDKTNATLLVASGERLLALDLADGGVLWTVDLEHPVVNASPLVTGDRGPRDRAFITDYALADLGAPGRLYCVNVDPFDPVENPHEPGDIVWAAPLGSGEISATPAYARGIVYVATSEGRILAFPASAEAVPAPDWIYTNTSGDGFFGGVSVYDGAVYAATYDFGVGQLAAEMVKLDAATGAQLWSVPCNRTDSVPVPIGGGLIALSAGVPPDPFFFDHGSAPSVALFEDLGPAAVMLWDSALDTWADDGDGVIENGEFLSIGGWTHLPAVVRRGGRNLLLVGSMDDDDVGGALFLPNTHLRLIDPMRMPADPLFVLDESDATGGSPAVDGGGAYSIGPGGVVRVGSPGRAGGGRP